MTHDKSVAQRVTAWETVHTRLVACTLGATLALTFLSLDNAHADPRPAETSPPESVVDPRPSVEPTVPAWTPPTAALVPVQVALPEGAQLEVFKGANWQTVCSSPCAANLSPGGHYRITGWDLRPSRTFRLEAEPGTGTVIEASTATQRGFAFGLALTALGGAGFVVGVVLVLAGIGKDGYFSLDPDTIITSRGKGLMEDGAATALIGFAVAVPGIFVWIANARTTVQQRSVPLRATTASAVPSCAWSSTDLTRSSARSLTIPLLSFSW